MLQENYLSASIIGAKGLKSEAESLVFLYKSNYLSHFCAVTPPKLIRFLNLVAAIKMSSSSDDAHDVAPIFGRPFLRQALLSQTRRLQYAQFPLNHQM